MSFMERGLKAFQGKRRKRKTTPAKRLRSALDGRGCTERKSEMRKDSKGCMARLGVACAVALIACAVMLGQNVRSNYMPGTDFTKYHTYKWVTVQGANYPNQIVDAQIKQAIDSQLATKGFSKTDNENADLYVAYQVAVNKETQWNAYGTGGAVRWGGGMGTATSSTINVGTLALDMYDHAAKKLVWQGTATKTINPSKNQEKNQKNLDKAMQKLLKDFPPKQK
jgi:Domain of unknown function (DUF4136)